MNGPNDSDISELREKIQEIMRANKGLKLMSLIDNSGAPILTMSANEHQSLPSDVQKRLSGAVAAAVALSNRAMRALSNDSNTSIGMRTENGSVGIVRSDHFILLMVTDHHLNARSLALQAERLLKEYV